MGAATLFTLDVSGDEINDLDGSDDLVFSFSGSTGSGAGGSDVVSGRIRSVDITMIDQIALQASIDGYVDFTGTTPVDFTAMDVLIFDIVLDAGSALLDEIGVSVPSNDPSVTNPLGGGYFNGCDPGLPIGCANNVPGGGEITAGPAAISLSPGFPLVFPGAALFEFDKNGLSAGNLEAGETSRRLFVTWMDTGRDSPISTSATVSFMLSSGTNTDFTGVDIVPEPATGALLGLGLALLGYSRKRAS